MKRIGAVAALTLIPALGLTETAQAGINPALFYTPSGILEVLIFLGSLICLLWSAKVMSLVKGGLLSRTWQMFSLGFGFLLIASLLSLGETVNIMKFPAYVFGALYLFMIVTWLVGLFQVKKALG